MKPAEFIAMVAPGAQEFQAKTKVFASVTIAQASLETGWGAFIPVDKHSGKVSYNLFGVKGTGPAGSVLADTWEVYDGKRAEVEAYFRAYHSYAESIADHGEVLLNERYDRVRGASSPEQACYALYRCGYATDPDYPYKLISIIDQYNLTEYDLTKEGIAMFEDLQKRLTALENEFAKFNEEAVSDWAEESVAKAQLARVMIGDEHGLHPKKPLTREEAVVMLDRLGLLGKGSRQ